MFRIFYIYNRDDGMHLFLVENFTMNNFKLNLLLLCLLFVVNLNAQQYFNIHNPVTLPDKSQESQIKQRIGYTDIVISYHSPGARGREIWGNLVPYGKVWRAGANENTVFTISHDVVIEGQTLPAGSYGLHLLPEPGRWTFIFSNNYTSWGSYFYDDEEDALRVTVKAEKAPEYREWMNFDFITRDRGQASVALTWGDKRAVFSMSLDIDKIALDHIRKQLRMDAYWEWFSWCQAAAYCAEYQINTEEALEWIDHSISMQENFSNYDVKADLLRQAGKEQAAQDAIARALELGTAIELERYGRRFLKQKDYDQAVSIFNLALKKDNKYWRAYLNKGAALEDKGDKSGALKAYQLALENASKEQKESVNRRIEGIE